MHIILNYLIWHIQIIDLKLHLSLLLLGLKLLINHFLLLLLIGTLQKQLFDFIIVNVILFGFSINNLLLLAYLTTVLNRWLLPRVLLTCRQCLRLHLLLLLGCQLKVKLLLLLLLWLKQDLIEIFRVKGGLSIFASSRPWLLLAFMLSFFILVDYEFRNWLLRWLRLLLWEKTGITSTNQSPVTLRWSRPVYSLIRTNSFTICGRIWLLRIYDLILFKHLFAEWIFIEISTS